jgi:hypothetical protein
MVSRIRRFLRWFRPDPQGGQQPADLGFTGLAGHDGLHRFLGFLPGQVLTTDYLIQSCFQHCLFLLSF